MKVGSPTLISVTYVKKAKIRSSLKFLFTQDLFLQPQEVNVVPYVSWLSKNKDYYNFANVHEIPHPT